MMVVFMNLEMLGKFIDAGGKQGDLNFGGAGIAIVCFVLFDNFGFIFL